MPISRLRKLAKDYFNGTIDEPGYHRERAKLLDGLVKGEIPYSGVMARPDPKPAPPPPMPDIPDPLDEPEASRLPKIIIGVGIGAVILMVIIIVVLSGQNKGSTLPPDSPLKNMMMPYLRSGSWSMEQVISLDSQWLSVPPAEQGEARKTIWYRRLVDNVERQIDQEKALAELEGNGTTEQLGRLHQLAANLDIEPYASLYSSPAPDDADALSPDEMDGSAISDELPLELPPELPLEIPPELAPDILPESETDNPWLDAQPGDHYSLQLFALAQGDNAFRLRDDYPLLELKVVHADRVNAPYRVLYGVFVSSEEASAAFEALPMDLTDDQSRANVRSVSYLQALMQRPAGSPSDLSPSAPPPSQGSAQTAVAGNWLAQQDPERYTLQLFALSNSDGSQRVLKRFPQLDLHLIQASEAPRFRILHGLYPDADAATKAHFRLPLDITRESRRPNVKNIADLQRIALP